MLGPRKGRLQVTLVTYSLVQGPPLEPFFRLGGQAQHHRVNVMDKWEELEERACPMEMMWVGGSLTGMGPHYF